MATVYTHISPFQKRAINFFGQLLCNIGKAGQINSVLDELFREQEFFREFLASFGPALQDREREYVGERLLGVEKDLDVALIEQTLLRGILELLNPCQGCNGNGEIRHIISQDHSEYSTCPACGGDGIAKSVKEVRA